MCFLCFVLKGGGFLGESSSAAAAASSSMLTWSHLRQYGVGWWLKSGPLLRQLTERLAKCLFQQRSDPLDAALFYLAMRKKGVLCALFKTVKDTRMSDFFRNDFAVDTKWQTAALKNAFVLLGKQRFEHAAAFFLLAGRVRDAVEVCLRKLDDMQLAIVLVRLYYESDVTRANACISVILCGELLGAELVTPPTTDDFGTLAALPASSVSLASAKCTRDPFLRTMTYWFVKDYRQALHTLYDIDLDEPASVTATATATPPQRLHFSTWSGGGAHSSIPHVFNFYTFLKQHPLVVRSLGQQQQQQQQQSSATIVSPVERRLHFLAAYYHLVNGCPLLALDILARLPKYIDNGPLETTSTTSGAEDVVDNRRVEEPKKVEKASDFDWSSGAMAVSSKRFDDDEQFKIDFSDDDDDDDDDDSDNQSDGSGSPRKSSVSTAITLDNKLMPATAPAAPTTTTTTTTNATPVVANRPVDTFAQQIKFIACLKILIGEMSTLATGFEVQGGQLRYYMYYWLERETQVTT